MEEMIDNLEYRREMEETVVVLIPLRPTRQQLNAVPLVTESIQFSNAKRSSK